MVWAQKTYTLFPFQVIIGQDRFLRLPTHLQSYNRCMGNPENFLFNFLNPDIKCYREICFRFTAIDLYLAFFRKLLKTFPRSCIRSSTHLAGWLHPLLHNSTLVNHQTMDLLFRVHPLLTCALCLHISKRSRHIISRM